MNVGVAIVDTNVGERFEEWEGSRAQGREGWMHGWREGGREGCLTASFFLSMQLSVRPFIA